MMSLELQLKLLKKAQEALGTARVALVGFPDSTLGGVVWLTILGADKALNVAIKEAQAKADAPR